MAVRLNHTIVHARDARASAHFYADVFGFAPAKPFGPFLDVETANGVTLAILGTDERYEPQHYAFLVSEAEFDAIFARVKSRGLAYWADPAKKQNGQTNTHFGGRGVYFEDPGGHFLEIITRPYGDWPAYGLAAWALFGVRLESPIQFAQLALASNCYSPYISIINRRKSMLVAGSSSSSRRPSLSLLIVRI